MSTPRFRFLLFLFGTGLVAAGSPAVRAQSTLASMRGTVHDPSGALVSQATVVLHRVESNTDRTVTTGTDGQYSATNLDPGTYELRITAKGFRTETDTGITLDARQQLLFDLTLQIPNGTETVTVNASEAGTINTADASISAALSTRAVEDLPANYRGAGSTSPLNVIQTLPGVQPDSGSYPPQPSASPNPAIKFSIQGGLPSQSETTVDGISAQNQTTNNILGDAFPSAEAIAEIRVDGVNNNAEYGQPGEITTITKSGTNKVHGSVYEYFQNSGFDAIPYGFTYASKPKKVANDFGASLAGPVYIPHLYNGRDHTFFFADYEGLRYATARGVQYVVPTALERGGNFAQEEAYSGGTLINPFTQGAYAGNQLTPNPSAAALLALFPLPNVNVGQPVAQVLTDAIPFNYVASKNNSINSNQYDLRLDRTIGSKGSAFARYTNKSINQVLPEDLALPGGSSFATYRIFASSFNYAFTPRLANEVRFGFTLEQDGQSDAFDGTGFTNGAKLNGLNSAPFNVLPHLGFINYTSGGERLNQAERSRLFQYVDNVTYTRGAHTFRFGGDVRTLTAFTPLGFFGSTGSDNAGDFYFDGRYTGNEFADYLAGVPYLYENDNVQNDNNGVSQAYAAYAQDTWKATANLTISFGARYELHPGFHSTNGELGNFDPSVARTGRLIYPTGYAGLLSVPELQGFNACPTAGITGLTGGTVNGAGCTPVVSNTDANLPSSLRTTPRQRVEPRFGFAYRPFGNNKTAIRGGVGYFNITTSGALFYALTGTLQSNLNSYYNSQPGTAPAYSFPNLPTSAVAGTPGTGVFYAAIDTNWHDPYSLQTNLSVDRDLGHNFGLRVSYIGLQTWHLVWQPELNQLPLSTTTAAGAQPRTAFPYPNFQAIYDRATSATSNYHSGQVELQHRFAAGFSFDSSYTLAKSLADNQGTYGAASGQSSFVDEQGGYDATDARNRHLDYGNVVGTRRHRFITNSVYELPYGHGKRFGGGSSKLVNLVAGGWQVAGILALQSGPALTAYISGSNTDPSGSGSGTLYYRQQRPDRVANANYSGHNRNQWFNKNAFQCPGGKGIDQTTGKVLTGYNSLLDGASGTTPCVVGGFDNVSGNFVTPIGRYGSESIGDLTGPRLISLSTGLSKAFEVTEAVRLRLEGTFTNVLNHTNLADPNLDVTSPSFGVISSARGSDFGGNRTGQVSLKLEF